MTPAQYATFKAAILADANLTQLVTDGSTGAIAEYYSVDPGTFYAWNPQAPVAQINNGILWARLTPKDAPDGTLLWQNRSMVCQGFQNNLMILLQGRDHIDGTQANIRQGLSDALSAVPSGVSGDPQAAGWANVKTALMRTCTRFEEVFASGAGTTASPATMTLQGYPSDHDVVEALWNTP